MTLLTERQHDCLYWAAQGKTSWEIGCILGISERTANFHISNTCDKLAVRTRQAAITAAMSQALLSPPRSASATTTKSHPTARVHGRRTRK
jgi:LuxR family transcriptional regulator of spore coat protein